MRKRKWKLKIDLLRLKGQVLFESEHHPYTVVKRDDLEWDEDDLDTDNVESSDSKTKAVGPWGSFWISISASVVFASGMYLASIVWQFFMY